MENLIEFSPDCEISLVPLADGGSVVVVDGALREPRRLVDFACENLARMEPDSRWQYPGSELSLAGPEADILARFFRRYLRHHFGLSRLVREAYARLSMVTLAPDELGWMQRMCHTDAPADVAGDSIIASVLYLFHDTELGGTAFFRPRPGVPAYHSLLQQGRPGPAASAHEFFAQPPSYHTGSNEFFELDEVVPARWNRMIFYRGDIHHSGHILHPEKLSPDPARGRLTLNGFYRVTRISA